MNLLSLSIVGLATSVVLSTILAFVLLPSIRSVLRNTCTTGEGIGFWTRFAVMMIYIGPLIVTLGFGLPSSEVALKRDPTELVLNVIVSALVGVFIAAGAIGLRIGTLRTETSSAPVKRQKTDDEYIK